jgi:hypothetical protein
MSRPIDKELYEKVKKMADKIYDKPSAYKSGYIVNTYKRMGGRYTGSSKNIGLDRWYKENWTDVNPNKTQTSYPVYRPTKRISKNTPLTLSEISPTNLKKQSKLKQKIKGNLPPFQKIK